MLVETIGLRTCCVMELRAAVDLAAEVVGWKATETRVA